MIKIRTVIITTSILVFTLLIIIPVYLSVSMHFKGQTYQKTNSDEISAYYNPTTNKIYLNKEGRFIEVNETYVGKGYFEKNAIAHEICHKHQDEQNRLRGSVWGLAFNEAECYIKGDLLIK
jgi:hypothetical protein